MLHGDTGSGGKRWTRCDVGGGLRLKYGALRVVEKCPGHAGSLSACSWAPDGSILVTASGASGASGDHTWIWRASDWSCLRTLTGHTDGVWACAWAPDGYSRDDV